MKDPARENLAELLRQFMDDSAARDAQADVDAAERLLEAHPAPTPSRETLSTIKALMIASAARRTGGFGSSAALQQPPRP